MSLERSGNKPNKRYRKAARARGTQRLGCATVGGAKQIGENLADRRAIENRERQHAGRRTDAYHHDA